MKANLVELSGDGDTYCFLVSKSFSDWTENLQMRFAPTPGLGGSKSCIYVDLPQEIIDDMKHLFPSSVDENLLKEWEITVGSAENDAYLMMVDIVQTFDDLKDVINYAIEHNIDVDKSNVYHGHIY